MTKKITLEKLIEQLNDPKTAEATIKKYFETTDENGAFSVKLTLKKEVAKELGISQEEFTNKAFTDQLASNSYNPIQIIVDIANKFKRRQRERHYEERIKKNSKLVKIIAEGDSWFQHPLVKDVIDHLAYDGKFDTIAVTCLSAAGEDVWKMVSDSEYVKLINKNNPNLFLISAGGNDLLGEEFHNFINKYEKGVTIEELINQDVFMNKIKQIKDYYNDVLSTLYKINPNMHIIGHTYAYARQKPGNWLSKPMSKPKNEKDGKGIPDKEQKAIIKYMVDKFHDLVLVKMKNKHNNFDFADVRDILPLMEDWYDEIHPNEEGSFHVAMKIYAKIKKYSGIN